ncbi:malate dehydrogenase [ANME-1 cluster archaeon GoMg4]|nr:malate dehydrogenase [ANME-1 cluster archaeon GoMg4]
MEEKDKTEEKEYLKAANKSAELALEYHSRYQGKIDIGLKAPVRSYDDFAIWYTPGVAEPSRAIQKNRARVYEYTNKGNSVAIVTDGTRVLGLGDVGAEAALPVMEGKAMLFKYLGGVDAFPICLATTEVEEIINVVKSIAPTFGGINLEDIESPKCYYLLERLREELTIPVWHDDQQGTALVILAGVINALKVVGKSLSEVTVSLIGAGAANMNVAKYMHVAGAKWKNTIMVDSRGILNPERTDVKGNESKWKISTKTNWEGRSGGIAEAMRGTDVCIALSTPGPGVIKQEWVASMADDAIVFAAANPVPEIWPWEAEAGGAKIIATGRSDFKNQINNSLGFPAVFRGTLDVRATRITDEMCIAAAYAIASYAEEKGISEDAIIPKMEEQEMYVREAVAVGMKAIELGVAEKKMNAEELEEEVRKRIFNKMPNTF